VIVMLKGWLTVTFGSVVGASVMTGWPKQIEVTANTASHNGRVERASEDML